MSGFERLGLPYVIEIAFGYAPSLEKTGRVFVSGLNFSPAIGTDPFRDLGPGRSLDGVLAQQWADRDEPVVVFVHLTTPRLNFLDKGKTQVALPDSVATALVDLAQSVTTRWAKQRRAEERAASAKARRKDALAHKMRPITLKEAAWGVMASAYAVASDNGRLPANPRQIYYAARGTILGMTGKERLDSNYFSQRLLVEYIEETGVSWDICWDDRGHFREPHTDREIGLGTLAVRKYDYSRVAYREIGHPAAHFHVGRNNDNRWPCAILLGRSPLR